MTARPVSTFAAAIACAVILLVAARAWAAPESGKAYFESGVRQYNLGHFKEAIVEFEKAYNIDPAPILLFNIAQSHRQLGDKERALFFYRRYLEQAPAAGNKREVEQRMKDLTESLQQERDLKQKPPPGVETTERSTTGPVPPPPPPPRTRTLISPSPIPNRTAPSGAGSPKLSWRPASSRFRAARWTRPRCSRFVSAARMDCPSGRHPPFGWAARRWARFCPTRIPSPRPRRIRRCGVSCSPRATCSGRRRR